MPNNFSLNLPPLPTLPDYSVQYSGLIDALNATARILGFDDPETGDNATTMPSSSFYVDEFSAEWSQGDPFPAKLKTDRKTFNSKRLAGIEWEYNDPHGFAHIREWARKWRGGNHYDGSCGYEAVTAPIAGDYIAECLKDLKAAFTRTGIRANSNCSVHVHVDAKDYTWENLQRLLIVYGKLEPLLYVLGGAKRVSNRYCSPCGSAYVKAIEGAPGGDKTTAILREAFGAHRWTKTDVENHHKRARKKDGGRYRGLNIIPWIVGKRDSRKDCTVEFRLHENTIDDKRVVEWVHLLVTLVDWCRKATDDDIAALPSSSTKALSIIAPNSKAWITSRIRKWRQDRRRGRTLNRIAVDRKGVFAFRTAARPQTQPAPYYPTVVTASINTDDVGDW